MALKFSTQAFVASASIFSVIAASVVAIPKVLADANGCTSSGSCVLVYGTGLRVNTAYGGVRLSPRGRVYGHTEVWGSYSGQTKFRWVSSDKDFFNSSYVLFTRVWDSEPARYGNNMPSGSKVCSQFWQKIGSDYQSFGIACVTIAP